MATTPNLGLHQWQAGDSFLRTDFNGDFGKIDAAVGGKTQMACGTYTGSTGQLQDNSGNNRDIVLSFTPRAVIVFEPYVISSESGRTIMAMAVKGRGVTYGRYTVLEIIPGGFRVGSVQEYGKMYCPRLNDLNTEYLYMAFS